MSKAKGKWEKPHGHWEYVAPDGVELDMGDMSDLYPPKAETGDHWGGWVYSADLNTLTFKSHERARSC